MKARLTAVGTFNPDGSLNVEMADGTKSHLEMDGIVSAISETIVDKAGDKSHSVTIKYGRADPVVLRDQAASLAMYWLADNNIDVVAIVKEK